MEPFLFEELDPFIIGVQFVYCLLKLGAVIGVEFWVQFMLSHEDFSQFEEDEFTHVLVYLLELQFAESVAGLQ